MYMAIVSYLLNLIDEDPNHLWPYFSEEFTRRLAHRRAEPSKTGSASPVSLKMDWFPLSSIEFSQFSEDHLVRRDLLKLHLQQYVHINLVACEELETYKKVVLGQVSSWLDVVKSRKSQHALLIQVTSTNATQDIISMRAAKPISRAGLVLERLLADFGGSKNVHIVQLRLKDKNDEGWEEAIEAFADALHSAFWAHIANLDDDIRRLEGQSKLPGWNFCTYYITKEALALSYSAVSMYDKALQLYLGLYSTFYDILHDDTALKENQSLQWASDIGLVDGSKVPEFSQEVSDMSIRNKFLHCEGTLFEFCMYNFGCIFHLYTLLNNNVELMEFGREAIIFWASLFQIRQIDNTFKCAEWSFNMLTRVMSIIDSVQDPDKIDQARKELGKCAHLAKFQLEKCLPKFFPEILNGTSLVFQKNLPKGDSKFLLVECDDLKELKWSDTILCGNKFFSTYKRLLDLALQGIKAGRLQDFVKCEMAIVHYIVGQPAESIRIINEVMDSDTTRDWEYICCLLHSLRAKFKLECSEPSAAVHDLLQAWKLDSDSSETIARLLPMLVESSKSLLEPMKIELEPFFLFRSFSASEPQQGRTNSIILSVEWNYDYKLLIDSISLRVASGDSDLEFRNEAIELNSATSTIMLYFSVQKYSNSNF